MGLFQSRLVRAPVSHRNEAGVCGRRPLPFSEILLRRGYTRQSATTSLAQLCHNLGDTEIRAPIKLTGGLTRFRQRDPEY